MKKFFARFFLVLFNIGLIYLGYKYSWYIPIWVYGSVYFIFLNWYLLTDYRAHKIISDVFMNHRKAIDGLNKQVKKLIREEKTLSKDLKPIKKNTIGIMPKVEGIDADIKKDIEEKQEEFQKKKAALIQQRVDARDEQKARKDALKQRSLEKAMLGPKQ